MNDADPKPINLDELRLLPDWLREDAQPPSKQYASHDFPVGDERGNRQGGRPGAFGRDRRDAGRPAGGGGRPPERRREPGRSGPPPPRGGQGRPDRDERRNFAPPAAPLQPAPVRVEFLPDEACLASINKQIRSTHLAYPLFGLARMFLQEPARHWVQFTLTPTAEGAAGAELYQLGEDGPIALDRQVLEKAAFDLYKDRFYTEQTEQKEPLKGNFTNVARCRLSGTLLGPTNYHAYQPALRSLYESRFSRRMPFDDFKRNIEIVTDPAVIERWKEEARTTTTIATVGEEPPTVLPSLNEARAHFRQHHLSGLLRSGTTLKVHGSVARTLPEPAMMQAIREAHERELRYPAEFVQMLRQGFQDSGLHIFKHRKRFVYVSLARPTPFVPHGAVSANVAAILAAVAESPLCTRKMIAERVLGKSTPVTTAAPVPPVASTEPSSAVQVEAPVPNELGNQTAEAQPTTPPEVVLNVPDDAAKGKAALAADLRFLVQAGHIIEFHNGTFDLPLPPKPKEDTGQKKTPSTEAIRQKQRADQTVEPGDAVESLPPSGEAANPEPETLLENSVLPEFPTSHDPATEHSTETTVTPDEGSLPMAQDAVDLDEPGIGSSEPLRQADPVESVESVDSVEAPPSSHGVEHAAPQP